MSRTRLSESKSEVLVRLTGRRLTASKCTGTGVCKTSGARPAGRSKGCSGILWGLNLAQVGLGSRVIPKAGLKRSQLGWGARCYVAVKAGLLVVEEMKPSGGRSLGLVSSLGGNCGLPIKGKVARG